MKGIQYLFDETGVATAVLIDLKEHADLWEDMYDELRAAERSDDMEPFISWEEVKRRMQARMDGEILDQLH